MRINLRQLIVLTGVKLENNKNIIFISINTNTFYSKMTCLLSTGPINSLSIDLYSIDKKKGKIFRVVKNMHQMCISLNLYRAAESP